MLITVSKADMLKTLNIAKSIFMIDNTMIGFKLIKGTPAMLIKKNEQCHGKFLVKVVKYTPYDGDLPEEDYFFVLNESAVRDAFLYSQTDNVTMEFSHKYVTIAGTKCHTHSNDNPGHFADVKIPKTANLVKKQTIEVTDVLKSCLKIGMPFVRALYTSNRLRIFDGVMYMERSGDDTFVYSTNDHQALMQVTSLDMQTCVLPNDFLKILADLPSNNFGVKRYVSVEEYELTEEHDHFHKYVCVCTIGNLRIIHSRQHNTYAPMHEIDYSHDEASYVLATTVEDMYKDLPIITRSGNVHFGFPNVKLSGEVIKTPKFKLDMFYDAALINKALKLFSYGEVWLMFKDASKPLIMYNEKYVIFTKNKQVY